MRARWAAVGAAVAVSLGGGVVMVANAGDPSNEVGFKSITPCRLLDTRTVTTAQIKPTGIRYDKIGNPSTSPNDVTVIFDVDAEKTDLSDDFTYKIPGTTTLRPIMGDCNNSIGDVDGINYVDAITAVVLNVTIVDASSTSFITVYPWQIVSGSSPRPLFSNLNPLSGVGSVTNQVTVDLRVIDSDTADPVELSGVKCTDGTHSDSDCQGYDAFRIYNNAGTSHVIVDVMGYYYFEDVL